MDSRKARLESILKAADWSDEDMEWLINELNGPEGSRLINILRQKFSDQRSENDMKEWEDGEQILGVLHRRMGILEERRRGSRLQWIVRSMAAAASLAIGIFLVTKFTGGGDAVSEKIVSSGRSSSDPRPGYDKAMLILPDGRNIVLDTTLSGQAPILADGLTIQVSNGSIGYGKKGGAVASDGQIPFHIVKTPRGGQYRLTLADGTEVWLNSASSIQYPAVFNGTERRVRVTGEAYFEVAHDKGKPYQVDVDGRGVVEVLGTRFNVNAYQEETHLGVTLLEGSVRFGKPEGSGPVRLVPGQQLRLYQDGRTRLLSGVETGAVIAWKDGKFNFGEGMEISEVMRQISRWYDVDIRYEGPISGHVGGSISRQVRLSRVLEMIEIAGLASFSIQEGVVTVAKPKG